jgi:hypothetical protein
MSDIFNQTGSAAEVQADIDPILNVFGGADGGVAFAKLRHHFLPKIYEKEHKTKTEEDFIKMVKQFSNLCKLMLDE